MRSSFHYVYVRINSKSFSWHVHSVRETSQIFCNVGQTDTLIAVLGCRSDGEVSNDAVNGRERLSGVEMKAARQSS